MCLKKLENGEKFYIEWSKVQPQTYSHPIKPCTLNVQLVHIAKLFVCLLLLYKKAMSNIYVDGHNIHIHVADNLLMLCGVLIMNYASSNGYDWNWQT